MRRTVNIINDYTLEQIGESKMNWSEVLNILEEARGASDSLEFKASEVGLCGAQMRVLMNFDIVKVIAQEECWFEIYDNLMKKGYINVYVFDTEVSNLLAQVKENKRKELLEKIEWCKEYMAELERKLISL